MEESEDKKSLTQNTMMSGTKDSKKANNTRSKKFSPTKAFANPTQTSTRSKKQLASPKTFEKPTLSNVASNNVPVVKKKRTRSKARAIDRKVNQVLRATTRNRSKATQNIKIKESDTNAFLDN